MTRRGLPNRSDNHDILKGLVFAWLPVMGPTGTVYKDYSGNHNDFLGSAGITWDVHSPGWAVNLSSGKTLLNTGTTTLNKFNKEVSVVAKLQTNQTTTTKYGIFESTDDNTVNSRFLMFSFTDGNLYWRVVRGGNTDAVQVTNPLTQFNWHDIVGTYRSGDSRIYHNGKQIAQRTDLTGTIDAANIRDNHIGKLAVALYTIDANFAALRIYERAITPEEVQTLQKDPLAGFRRRRTRRKLITVSATSFPFQHYYQGSA